MMMMMMTKKDDEDEVDGWVKRPYRVPNHTDCDRLLHAERSTVVLEQLNQHVGSKATNQSRT